MNIVDFSNQKLMQPLERFSLLRKLAQDCVNGRLEVFSNLQQWSIFFDKGKLIYACQSNGMWDIFYKKLLELKPDFPTFGNQAYSQLQLIFDCEIEFWEKTYPKPQPLYHNQYGAVDCKVWQSLAPLLKILGRKF